MHPIDFRGGSPALVEAVLFNEINLESIFMFHSGLCLLELARLGMTCMFVKSRRSTGRLSRSKFQKTTREMQKESLSNQLQRRFILQPNSSFTVEGTTLLGSALSLLPSPVS